LGSNTLERGLERRREVRRKKKLLKTGKSTQKKISRKVSQRRHGDLLLYLPTDPRGQKTPTYTEDGVRENKKKG